MSNQKSAQRKSELLLLPLVLEPEAILESRDRKLGRRTIMKFLACWKNLPDEDATWEGEHIFEYLALRLLEGKKNLGGEDCHVPSQTHL